MYYVYILHGSRYYVGYTNNLHRRFHQHAAGFTTSTSKYGQLTLVGYFLFEEKSHAIQRELTIKKSKNIKKRIQHPDFMVIQ